MINNIHPSIELINLDIGYSVHGMKKIVYQRINGKIYSGQLTFLLGENGVGKSTFLKTLSGFQKPLKGEIKIYGKDILAYSTRELSKTISIVTSSKEISPVLSVKDTVSLGRSPYTGFWGLLGTNDRKIVENAMESSGIMNLSSREIATLSDGEKQKVIIAKAIAQTTPVILLDEPTAFLDFPSKIEIIKLLSFLAKERQKAIMISIHDLDLALQSADKLWLMDKSGNMFIGTTDELSEQGSFDVFMKNKSVRFNKETKRFYIK